MQPIKIMDRSVYHSVKMTGNNKRTQPEKYQFDQNDRFINRKIHWYNMFWQIKAKLFITNVSFNDA